MLSSCLTVLGTLLVLAAGVPAAAQTTPPPAPPPETAPPQPAAAATPAAPAGPSRIHYGVRYGPSFTTLTSVEPFDETAVVAAFEPTLNFGGYVQIELTGAFSFQPEVLFAAKGHRIRDKNAQPISTPTGELKLPAADRVVLVRYLEFPLLMRLSRRTHENTSVYLIGGPSFAMRRNAVIREVADAGRREDIADLVSGSDFSYVFGAGLQHRRWLVDARFTRGMRNIATDPTLATVKTGAFSVLMGTRF
jgi:hypothetical protein